jgi:hypothetical protein
VPRRKATTFCSNAYTRDEAVRVRVRVRVRVTVRVAATKHVNVKETNTEK